MRRGTPGQWTAEELVGELRRRERVSAKRAAGGARAVVPRAPGRLSELERVPTRELAQLAKARQRVIYGVDNRKDIFQVKSAAVRAAAEAVVALVKAGDLTRRSDGHYALATESYAGSYQLCGSEPFVSQPLGCFCSGFLVGPDVIATAGHCVKGAGDLKGVRFVFGFRMKDASRAHTVFPPEDVYAGAAVIGRQLADDGTDWALVRLDRVVAGRKPLRFRKAGKVRTGQSLYVVGHPCGLPQKYAPGARVRHNSPKSYFVANLDTYGGNSGSPVFDARTHRVEGILVRGETDFVSNGSCYVSMVCPSTGCRGEDVTRTTVWAARVTKRASAIGTGARTRSPTSTKRARASAKRPVGASASKGK
jgi:S1-C subfamily serine protease